MQQLFGDSMKIASAWAPASVETGEERQQGLDIVDYERSAKYQKMKLRGGSQGRHGLPPQMIAFLVDTFSGGRHIRPWPSLEISSDNSGTIAGFEAFRWPIARVESRCEI